LFNRTFIIEPRTLAGQPGRSIRGAHLQPGRARRGAPACGLPVERKPSDPRDRCCRVLPRWHAGCNQTIDQTRWSF